MSSFKKDDTNKLRYDLLPFAALDDVARNFTQGLKYGERNWEKATPDDIKRLQAALYRHASKAMQGERMDEDSGVLHWSAVATNALMLAWHEMQGTKEEPVVRREMDENAEPVETEGVTDIEPRHFDVLTLYGTVCIPSEELPRKYEVGEELVVRDPNSGRIAACVVFSINLVKGLVFIEKAGATKIKMADKPHPKEPTPKRPILIIPQVEFYELASFGDVEVGVLGIRTDISQGVIVQVAAEDTDMGHFMGKVLKWDSASRRATLRRISP